MTLEAIEQNLKETQIVFRSIIIDTNFTRTSEGILSWPNYIPGINNEMYLRNFEGLRDNRQFTFLFIDSSFIQAYFECDDEGVIIQSKLAYYPAPFIKKLARTDVEDYFDEATDDIYLNYYMDLLDQFEDEVLYTNNNHIRFDYSSTVETHSKNHIQFGGINDVRIPLKFLLLPFTFVDFVVRNTFVEQYKKINGKPSHKATWARSQKYFELDSLDGFNSIYISKDFE